MDSPFLQPDDPRLPEIFTDATVHILAARGIDQFSVRAIARWMRVAPATILNEYSRARLLELVVICFSQRWLAWSGSGDWWSERACPLRLPRTDAERHGVRVLAALEQLALAVHQRGNPLPLGHVRRLYRDELDLVMARLARHPGLEASRRDRYARLVQASVRGLRAALAVPDPSLSWEEAVEVIRAIEAAPDLQAGRDAEADTDVAS